MHVSFGEAEAHEGCLPPANWKRHQLSPCLLAASPQSLPGGSHITAADNTSVSYPFSFSPCLSWPSSSLGGAINQRKSQRTAVGSSNPKPIWSLRDFHPSCLGDKPSTTATITRLRRWPAPDYGADIYHASRSGAHLIQGCASPR